MKILLIIIVLTSSLKVLGQIKFENGYFIDENDQRVECLIKNVDWKDNPTEFEYQLAIDSDKETGTRTNIKEFGINGFSRYVRAETKIDISPADIDNLSKERNPEWQQQLLFLKVLVEGKATLYYFEKDGLIRFFYSVSDTAIKQLIYKEYYTSDNQVAENFKFREQLWIDVRCADASMSSVENIRFNKSELERYFKKYNSSEGKTTVMYDANKKRDSFHLRFTPGLNYSWASVTNVDNSSSKVDFNDQINFRIGFEAEVRLPFNKNKWGIMFDPSYQYFNSSGQNGSFEVDINYQSIEFPLGLRHYFFLNDNLNVFINALWIPGYSIVFNSKMNDLDIGTRISYALGGGIGYKKLSAEMRYCTNRDLLNSYISLDSDYRRLSLILGFRIL